MKIHRIRPIAFTLAMIMLGSFSLCACGKSAEETWSTASTAAYDSDTEYFMEASEENASADSLGAVSYSVSDDTASVSSSSDSLRSDKIIYSADASLETTEFDSTVEKIYSLVDSLGGFMESTYVSGYDYYQSSRGTSSTRSASFTIRVPSENFNTLTGSLSSLGNVPYCNTYSENITQTYYDTQSRLDAYRAQETRLLEMMEIAETVEDMLAIQSQLTEVQYEIDSLQSRLNNYDTQVNYSTVNLSLREVTEYTPEPENTLSFWQKMGRGFTETLSGIGTFFVDLALWIGSALPVLILLAIIALIVVLIIRSNRKKRPEREARRAAKRRAAYAKAHPETSGSASEACEAADSSSQEKDSEI